MGDVQKGPAAPLDHLKLQVVLLKGSRAGYGFVWCEEQAGKLEQWLGGGLWVVCEGDYRQKQVRAGGWVVASKKGPLGLLDHLGL